MIHIEMPSCYATERSYILSVLFRDFLGLEIEIECTDRRDTLITSADKGRLIVADGLFDCPKRCWLTAASLPQKPLKVWDTESLSPDLRLVTPMIPVIYGNPFPGGEWILQGPGSIRLGLDIFGSAFFMLSRYEESVKPDRDSHDRFPATGSLAYEEGFLYRPIVNEYVEILYACLRRLWPSMGRKKRNFRMLIGHDVDFPYYYSFMNPLQLLRNCTGDILLRHNFFCPIRRVSTWMDVKRGNMELDPYNTFNLMIDITEENGLKSTFFFLTDHLSNVDGNYSIKHPLLRTLLRFVYERGHSIGLHASYNSYRSREQTKKEFGILKQVCEQEGIGQEEWGGRQHFLRWHTPTTFKNLDDAGLDYDSTLSFADHVGFRCGSCYEYPVFDVVGAKPLRLRERPLIVMDSTVTERQYMNLGKGEAALQTIKTLKDVCRTFDGDFSLLWHNTRLADSSDVALFKGVLGDK